MTSWNTPFPILRHRASAPRIACDSLTERRLLALDIVGNVSPDLVLMDIQMPRMGGLEVTRLIEAHHPHKATQRGYELTRDCPWGDIVR